MVSSLNIPVVDNQLAMQVEIEYDGNKVCCTVLVDTGATFTIFDEATIDKIHGMYETRKMTEGIGGSVSSGLCFVYICLIDFKKEKPCFSRNVRVVKKVAGGYSGLLGMDVLKTMDWKYRKKDEVLTLTYNSRKINL